jgi:hypothetical protein
MDCENKLLKFVPVGWEELTTLRVTSIADSDSKVAPYYTFKARLQSLAQYQLTWWTTWTLKLTVGMRTRCIGEQRGYIAQ